MTVRAPDGLQQKLSNTATKMGLSRNALILVILDKWLETQTDSNEEEILNETGYE